MIHLVLGGARSGKSRYAENLAEGFAQQGSEVVYFATARHTLPDPQGGEDIVDAEMVERIAKHQADRAAHWQTQEVPIHLADALRDSDSPQRCLLVDCLTLWTLNLIEDDHLQQERQALLETLPKLQAQVVLVSNEVGQGIVPMGELTRRFVDELGWLHQAVAERADQVTFMTAGLPMVLKSPS